MTRGLSVLRYRALRDFPKKDYVGRALLVDIDAKVSLHVSWAPVTAHDADVVVTVCA